jgi:hypothetical protein
MGRVMWGGERERERERETRYSAETVERMRPTICSDKRAACMDIRNVCNATAPRVQNAVRTLGTRESEG